MAINPVGGNFSLVGDPQHEQMRAVPVILSTKSALPTEEADALIKSLGFSQADLEAYQALYGVDLRQKLVANFTSNHRAGRYNPNAGDRFYDAASKSYKVKTYIGVNDSFYKQLTGFIAERRNPNRQTSDSAVATRAGQELNTYGSNQRNAIEARLPLAEVTVMASADALPLEMAPPLATLPTATEIGVAAAKTGAVIAETAPPVAMIAAEAAAPLLIADHLAQKYVEGKRAFEMQQADAAYRAAEAASLAEWQRITNDAPGTNTLPPFGNNQPLPPPPPFINPNQSEQGRKLSQPLTTPLNPPNVTTNTPPFANNQPLPPPPPMVNPIREQSAQDLIYAASMSKQLADNMVAAGMGSRPAGYAAHHIVPWDDKRFEQCQQARDIIDRFGITINEAVNGVYLPQTQMANEATSAQYHRTVHTEAYYQEVVDRLSVAKTKEEAIEVLNEIRTELQNGTFPK